MHENSRSVVHVIDDDDGVRMALAMLLEADGQRVKTHSSAREFLSSNGQFADTGCLVVDLNMPEMDGVELLEQLHVRGRWFPVIVITGHPDSILAGRARSAGVRAVLKKPINGELLMDHIHAALGSKPRPDAA